MIGAGAGGAETEAAEATAPCLFCPAMVPVTRLQCSSCKAALPYCIVTVHTSFWQREGGGWGRGQGGRAGEVSHLMPAHLPICQSSAFAFHASSVLRPPSRQASPRDVWANVKGWAARKARTPAAAILSLPTTCASPLPVNNVWQIAGFTRLGEWGSVCVGWQGRHLSSGDVSCCPHCRFPALYTHLKKFSRPACPPLVPRLARQDRRNESGDIGEGSVDAKENFTTKRKENFEGAYASL